MSVTAPNNNHQRRSWLIGMMVLFLLAAFGYALYWFFISQYQETTEDAYVAGNHIQVMSQIPGHISAIFADETNHVRKGDILIELDKADAEIALNNAKAQLAVTVRQVNQYFDSVNEAKANVMLQESNLEKAAEDFERRKKLSVNKTISEEEERHAKLALDAAKNALDLAKQQLIKAKTLVGTTSLYHHPQVQQAAVNLRNAYLNWRRTVIYAPENGMVAKRFAQVGQQINANSVLMVIVPLNQVWVDANFKESQLRHIRIGQPVSMFADAYGRKVKFKGKVAGLNPGTGSVFDILPPQNATGNWIKIVQRLPVRIVIPPDQLKEHPLQVGLSMTVRVDTHKRTGEPLHKEMPLHVLYQSQDLSSDIKEADKIIEHILQENAKNIEPLAETPNP